MKLQLGVPDYPYEGGLTSASIRSTRVGRSLPVAVVSMKEFQAHRAKFTTKVSKETKPVCNIRGFPTMVSLDSAAKRLWVFPSPNGEYELDIKDDDGELATAGPKPPLEGTLKMPKKDVPR